MKVSYKGKLDSLFPAQLKKWDSRLAKLSKLVDGRDEREAHVILTAERHQHRAEITVHLHDHSLVGAAASADLLTAMTSAAEKLEKQVRKLKTRKRDTRRGPEKSIRTKPVREAPASKTAKAPRPEPKAAREKEVYRANKRANQKPLTLEEAMLTIDDGRDYLVYRDAETNKLSVLLRRKDGNFDLVDA